MQENLHNLWKWRNTILLPMLFFFFLLNIKIFSSLPFMIIVNSIIFVFLIGRYGLTAPPRFDKWLCDFPIPSAHVRGSHSCQIPPSKSCSSCRGWFEQSKAMFSFFILSRDSHTTIYWAFCIDSGNTMADMTDKVGFVHFPRKIKRKSYIGSFN